jgi:hypothetical protein
MLVMRKGRRTMRETIRSRRFRAVTERPKFRTSYGEGPACKQLSDEFDKASPARSGARQQGEPMPGIIMPSQNSVSSFAAVGQFSSDSAIHRGEVRDGWRGLDVGSVDRASDE